MYLRGGANVQEFSKVKQMSVSFRCSQNATAAKWTKILILCTLGALKGTDVPPIRLQIISTAMTDAQVVALMEISWFLSMGYYAS